MPKILMLFGILTFLPGLGSVFLAASEAEADKSFTRVIFSGLPFFSLGGAFYCFGAIIDHLRAIRRYHKRQIDILEEMRANQISQSLPRDATGRGSQVLEIERARLN